MERLSGDLSGVTQAQSALNNTARGASHLMLCHQGTAFLQRESAGELNLTLTKGRHKKRTYSHSLILLTLNSKFIFLEM